jgi:hypothetical protein
MIDRLGQRPTIPLSELSEGAVGVQFAAERRSIKRQRRAGETQLGATHLTRLEVESINLDNSNPSAGNVPTVQIDVCWDVAHVDVVDANGKSIVSPNRPDSGWTQLTVANYHYATDPAGGWRVATGQDLKRKPCAAS